MANITVSAPLSNVTVNSESSVVTVTSTPSNITVGETAQTTTATIRAAISNTSPITYSNSTGVIGIDSTAFTSNITTTGNVSASYYLGNGSLLTGIDELTNAQAQAFIEANGLDATANLETSASLVGAYLHGDGSNITGLSFTSNAQAKAYIEANGLDATANLESNDHVVGRKIISGVRISNTTVVANGNIEAGNIDIAGTGKLELGGNVEGSSQTVFIGGALDIGTSRESDIAGWGFDGSTDRLSAPIGGSPGANATYYVDLGVAATQFPNFNWYNDSNSDLQAWQVGFGALSSNNLLGGGYTWYRGNNTLQANTLESLNSIQADGVTAPGGTFTITGEGSITGNLVVGGNLDYTHVNDLYVANNEIIMNSNAATDVNVTITVNRPVAGSNAYIRWDETADEWKFYDGSTEFTYLRNIVEDTTPQLGGNLDVNNKQILLGNATNANAQLIFGSGYSSLTGSRIWGDGTTLDLESGNNANIISYANMVINFGIGGNGGENFKLKGTGTTDTFIEAIHNGELRLGATSPTAEIIIGESGQAPIQFTQEADSNSNITTSANINAAGGTLTGIVTSNSNIQMTDSDAIFIGDINGAIQQEVRNESGVTIDRGKAVYLTGVATGNTPHVALANAEVVSEMPAIGVVKNQIANASVGEVVISGQLNIGTHSFTIGSQLYINGAGDLTETIPLGEGNLVQKIGKVVTSQQIIVQGAGRTNATPNLDEGNIFLGSSSGTTISVTPDTNFDTTGNVFSLSNTLTDVNSITSETASALKLRGQTGGIELDKTVQSNDTTIVDIDTDGYTLADATMPADFTDGDKAPTIIVKLDITNGSNTATGKDIFNSALGTNGDVAALRGPGFDSTFAPPYTNRDLICTTNDTGGTHHANIEAAMTTAGINIFGITGTNGLNNAGAGLYGQDKGWRPFNLSTGRLDDIFPLGTYVTGVSGSTVTFSENATLATTANVTLGLIPGMVQTSNSNVQLKYQTRISTAYGGNSEIAGLYGLLQTYDNPSTLANTTFDAVSYGNTSSVTASTVNTKNIVDVDSGNESATRFTRGLLVGPSASPDPFSGRTETNNPSALGVILENDGETFTGTDAPAAKFLINSYSGNLDDLTELPNWGTLGGTGNITLDLPQLKAPQLSLKAFRGAKSTANVDSYRLQAGDVVGKIAWNIGQTTGLSATGGDLINPPAGITVDVGDANINTAAANAYMHITTSPYPNGGSLGYFRNNSSDASGINQQTNFTTKDGNVTIAAQTDGKITLAPTPDYGDSGNATVWTRFPGATHEYHTFLDASFISANATSKSGTIIEVQPKSGTTTGSGGLGYDSVGNSVIRLSSHHSNSDVKAQWDITNEQSSGNLTIRDHTNDRHVLDIGGDSFNLGSVLRLHNLSNTAILALTNNQAGDMVYNSTDNLVAYFDGTDWRNIAQGAIIT